MKRELLSPSGDTVAAIENQIAGSAMGNWFGAKVSLKDGQHLYQLTFDEPHIGNPVIRALHGGVISAFLEYCATQEVLSRIPDSVACRSISVHTSYLRGSRDQDFFVAVDVQRIGRRIAFVEAKGWQDDRDKTIGSAQIALRLFGED